jgi:hypothetical protein
MTPLPPLTHHQILELVEPFSRRGRHPDLAASDRAARRLVFRPVEHGPSAAALPALVETLELDAGDADALRLTRTLATPDGLHSTLWAEGPDVGDLLARIEAVPHERQFLQGAGAGPIAALRQRLAAAQGAEPDLVLQGAQARVADLTLQMKVTGVRGYPAELELLRDEGDVRALPEDLLAVLGRPWDRLTAVQRGWLGAVQLRGSGPQRSSDAKARLALTLDHLARTLAEPPARFHERHAGARWRFALRGMAPLAVGVAIVAVAMYVQRLGDEHASLLAALANLAPPLLMGMFFVRREMPRISLPRPPRRLAPTAWGPRGSH